jgi:hypothetical protein
VDPGDRPRVVQRGEIADRLQVVDHVAVDPGRLGVPGPTVHDAVADRVDPLDAVEELLHRLEMAAALPTLDRVAVLDPAVPQDRQLQAARPGVDDEHAHYAGSHFHSATSGMSSP